MFNGSKNYSQNNKIYKKQYKSNRGMINYYYEPKIYIIYKTTSLKKY